MLEKVTHIAEQTAVSVSRRQFLGRLGRSAATAATAVGGVLAFSKLANAGRVPKGTILCCYKRVCIGGPKSDCDQYYYNTRCKTKGHCGGNYDFGVVVANCGEC